MNPLNYDIVDPCIIGKEHLVTGTFYSVEISDYPLSFTVANTPSREEAEFIRDLVKKYVEDPDSLSVIKHDMIANTVVDDEFFAHYALDDIAIKRQIWEWERDNLGLPWKEEE